MKRFVLVVVSIAALAVACSKEGNGPEAPEPTADPSASAAAYRSPLDDLPGCASDVDCPVSQTCQSKIRAACETCDGGSVVQVCMTPETCADDSGCQAPRRCQEGSCR